MNNNNNNNKMLLCVYDNASVVVIVMQVNSGGGGGKDFAFHIFQRAIYFSGTRPSRNMYDANDEHEKISNAFKKFEFAACKSTGNRRIDRRYSIIRYRFGF